MAASTKCLVCASWVATFGLTLALTGCTGKYAIGYSLDPLNGPPIKFSTPVLVRSFVDQRPVSERLEPDDVDQYTFYSYDMEFNEPVADGITRAFQLELANSGFEVADAGNHLIGNKPYIRILGDVLHFHVSRRDVPIDTMQHGVKTLWQRERYTVKVSVRIRMIDAKSRKLVMQRVYSSEDSYTLRSKMIDVKTYSQGKPSKDGQWEAATKDYCINLLNEHLKRVLVQARQDIVRLLTPRT